MSTMHHHPFKLQNPVIQHLLLCAVFAVVTLCVFGIYTERQLNGDSSKHILAGAMFGTPSELKARGIEPLYTGPKQSGWDGQFYYYMANDLLGTKDTAEHIDAPSYRYQRIGLSMYAKAASLLAGRSWVSPITFFASYFVLLLAATWVGAWLFSQHRLNPWQILFWSLSVGVQLTLFNALPDAAADAFLIIALAAFYMRHHAMAIVLFAMAALCREVYILFPIGIALALIWESIGSVRAPAAAWSSMLVQQFKRPILYGLALPILVTEAWQYYITEHFHASPRSQAHGILGAPLRAWFDNLYQAIRGAKIHGVASCEAACLLIFIVTLAIVVLLSVRTLRRDSSVLLKGIAISGLLLTALYLCFGETVMQRYTGYMKAASVFAVIIPLLAIDFKEKRAIYRWLLGWLVLALAVPNIYNLYSRILPMTSGLDRYTQMSKVNDNASLACFDNFNARVRIDKIEFLGQSKLSQLLGEKRYIVVGVTLSNTGDSIFRSTLARGTVHMSYHWTDVAGNVVQDGVRSALPKPIAPGESVYVEVISPISTGLLQKAKLQLTPVQEGCAWFYKVQPESGTLIDIKIH